MRTKAATSVLLTILMLSSGCLGLFGDTSVEPEIIDCEVQPNHPDCIEEQITEDDCRPDQIFTGSECRQMQKPENLSYGLSMVSLTIGEEMQSLTPSFTGDGPQFWIINPSLPLGIIFDRDSGVISGAPEEVSESIRYTIIGSNAVGSTNAWIDLEVIVNSPTTISYLEQTLACELGKPCGIPAPIYEGGTPDDWTVYPQLPNGISLFADGSISGTSNQLGDSNHTISAANMAGSIETTIRIIILHEAPMGLGYGSNNLQLSIGDTVQVIPSTTGGEIVSWSVEPPFPEGLNLMQIDGSIRGSPTEVQTLTMHRITASNSGGSISVDVLISVADMPVSNLLYNPWEHDLRIGEQISITPSYSGGTPDSWQISPSLPSGFQFNSANGTISGVASEVQPSWESWTIWANNTGGSTSTIFKIKVTSMAPDLISWENNEYILESNQSVFIQANNDGPEIESWEIEPQLPDGLYLLDNGSIFGTPTHNTNWIEYTIWANNSGGSVGLNLWIVVHDLRADQEELLRGMGQTNWGGWPSPILPIGEWSFPVGFAEGGYTDSIPVISASHVGRGKMLGYGHESWVDGAGVEETEFSLRAVEWVCGENANVGLAYGAGFEDFEDELQAEGHTVHLSVTPADLTGIDCLLDEFWNGHDDQDNLNLINFMLAGGGLIMGGHAWYWSYSNSDVAHNYPGNKIAKTTGLFVSQAWGYNSVNLTETPHPLARPQSAIQAIYDDRINNQKLSINDASIADSTLSVCTGVVSLDFHDFWSPLRDTVNTTGWTVIEYGTLWQNVGHNMGDDPVADTLLRVEAALTQGLPANELPAHPSHVEFPGEVPANTTRVTTTVSVDGNQSGLPSNFGYAGARAHVRMSTGLYAAPGDVVTVTLPSEIVDSGAYVLVGAHSDKLWSKSQLHRHPEIVRWWYVDDVSMEVGNAFGGPIYIAIEPGSTLGDFQANFTNAVEAPMFVLGETSDFEWIYSESDNPAPWAELVSDNFIMTVPSHEIRDLTNPTDLMDWWDIALEMEHELYGYLPWPRVERAVFDAQISAGWMHSGYPFMAHDLSVAGVVNVSYMSENGDWGMFHELGHNHQWMPSTLPGTTETGCNFASVYLMEDLVGIEGHNAVDPAQRANRMRGYFDDGSNIANWSVWTALDTYLIIKEEWGWDPITQALTVYYTLPTAEVPTTGDEEFNAWVLHLSNATGYNLAPYHAAWGFPLTQNTHDSLTHFPIWVDDPLRGEYFTYQAILRNLGVNNTTSSSSTFNWETYDNGTNTSLTIYYGPMDMGNQSWVWANSVPLGDSAVGWSDYEITGLSSNSTYYARVKASNEIGDTWFGPVNWTTSSN